MCCFGFFFVVFCNENFILFFFLLLASYFAEICQIKFNTSIMTYHMHGPSLELPQNMQFGSYLPHSGAGTAAEVQVNM